MAELNNKDKVIIFFVNALEKAFSNYSKRYNSCIKNFSDDSVHDIRVSIRRFIALLKLLESLYPNEYISRLKRVIKQQLKSFSKLRDTDVQLGNLKEVIHKEPVLYTFYNSLLKNENDLINGIRESLPDYNLIEIEGLVLFIRMELKKAITANPVSENQIITFAKQAFTRVLDLYEEANSEDLDSIHKVRLAFKNYRYLMEIIQALEADKNINFEAMKQFQTILGNIQDNVALLRDLQSFISFQWEIPDDAYHLSIENILKQREELVKEFFNYKNKIKDLWDDIYIKKSE
ncbi:MAG: CHAD domain-containing protein [Ignavibacteriae bacterium]|nr:CHAD domain-containing protein [Ignavibacteriota bacterium]